MYTKRKLLYLSTFCIHNILCKYVLFLLWVIAVLLIVQKVLRCFVFWCMRFMLKKTEYCIYFTITCLLRCLVIFKHWDTNDKHYTTDIVALETNTINEYCTNCLFYTCFCTSFLPICNWSTHLEDI